MTQRICNGSCSCCDDTVEEINARSEARRAEIRAITQGITGVIGAVAVSGTLIGVVAFNCFCAYSNQPAPNDMLLMLFLYAAVGGLIGISTKEIIQLVKRG